MAKNDRILADERPLEHFLAILAHFMPIYTRIFENGTARLRCPSGVSRALFCRSETISKVGNIKIMSASSPFFFSPLSPPFSFLCFRVGVQKTRFRCRSGQNGQIFRSHLFKNPGRYIYIYIHPFSKTLQLEKYIYIYIYLLFSYLFFCFRVVKTKDVYMYIYFSSCNVFENGCIYIYIYINKEKCKWFHTIE